LEFTYFGEDLGESVCEPIESRTGVAVWERAAKGQHEILGDERGVDEAVVTCAQRSG
jgi:hypothetical protein